MLLVDAIATSMLAGFGGSDDSKTETGSDEKTNESTLSLWTVFTGSYGDVLREIIKDYNETNEDGIANFIM